MKRVLTGYNLIIYQKVLKSYKLAVVIQILGYITDIGHLNFKYTTFFLYFVSKQEYE